MNIFLTLISFLIYTAHSQQCSNTHNQATIFSVSVNRAVLNVEGGVSNYVSIVHLAADAILPASSKINIHTYGASTSQINMVTNSGYAAISPAIDDIADADFANTFGNEVSDALLTAAGILWTGYGQRYHIVFAASNPLKDGLGTSTSPENFDRPCVPAVAAKQMNIQTYVVLIGTQGKDYVKEYFYCLVEDKINDIIEVDPNSPSAGIALLKTRLCKTDGIDVQITEVSPVAGYYPPYIEVLNRGRDALISACFAGGCTGTPGQVTPTGEFFVAYGAGGSNSLSPANPGTGLPAGSAANWVARARVDGGVEQTVSKDGTFQAQTLEHSYALRAVGFNNQYGANWRMSCGDSGGTPGLEPLDKCVVSGGNPGFCDDAECAVANVGEVCDLNQNYCDCDTATLFSDGDTCITAAQIDAGSCSGYVIPQSGIDFTYLAWDMEYDGIVSHSTVYPDSASSTGVAVTGEVNVMAVMNMFASGSVDVTVSTTVNSPIGLDMNHVDAVALSCLIGTIEPTSAPSGVPTKSPSRQPSGSPTRAPTFDDPGVYIAAQGVCGNSRCNCFENARDCCTPFGPQYNVSTLTAGSIPSPLSCENQFKSIEVSPDDRDGGKTESVYLGKYGGSYATTISYTIYALGQMNKTDFEDLGKWTDYYEVVRRRLRRRLLQTTTTPAPTTLYGNKLNINMRPPGGNEEFSGTVSMAAGALQTVLSLNVSTATLKCEQGDECTTYEECQLTAMGYMLLVTGCSTADPSLGDSCSPLYPTTLWISVTRNNALCGIVFGVGSNEDELPDWFWWVLIALIVFLLILAWLVYRFWWKQKKTTGELGDAEDELDQQQADNEQGFGKDLDVGDVAFNPMATGVPGMSHQADAFGNELHQRQVAQQNDMVDVQAEIFQVRQDYGQVATGPRGQNQNQY